MNWYALYTKPRNEQKVAQKLQALGIIAYCPLVLISKQWSDRKKKVLVPLLPSYVFVQIEEQNRKDVFQVGGVVQYVFWLGKPAIIKPNEIEALKQQLDSSIPVVHFEMTTWRSNETIQITEGVFKGQDAIVDKISTNKVRLLLKSLNMYITIER